jgi:hypothetical protein
MTARPPVPAFSVFLVFAALIPAVAVAQHKPATGPSASSAATRFAICIGVGPGATYLSHPVPVKNENTRQEFTAFLMKSYGTNTAAQQCYTLNSEAEADSVRKIKLEQLKARNKVVEVAWPATK